MPRDPDLYGQKPAKKQKRMALPGSLDFVSQLTTHLASQRESAKDTDTAQSSDGSPAGGGLSRRSRKPPSLHARASRHTGSKLALKNVAASADDSLVQIQRSMEAKARKYDAMKYGDPDARDAEHDSLVDFDRKWAEGQQTSGGDARSDSENTDDDLGHEMVEFEDEFGRTRRGTKREKEEFERRQRLGIRGAAELDGMAARPRAPVNVIHGDIIQSLAFMPGDTEKMEGIAKKRDRSATPPPSTHYDAGNEIRTKGVGFYQFSRDEQVRTDEMQSLDDMRSETEISRRERDEELAVRRQAIEQRRRDIEAKRARKMADDFLSKLA